MTTAPLISATALTRRFDGRLAVDKLSLTLAAGQVLALLGPTGAGKTTTMRMLAGLLAPSSGTATVCGFGLGQRDQDNDAIRARCGVVPEAPGFYERLTARQNLRFFAGLHGLATAEVDRRVTAELQRFNLSERGDDRVGTYSKGMKQRLSLARALLHQPQLLFLDEPTAGLDPKATAELHQLISELRAAGKGIVLSTHTLEEAEALADEILVIDTRPLFHGRAQDLQPQQDHEVAIEFIGDLPAGPIWPEGCRLLGTSAGRARFAVIDPHLDTPRLVVTLVAAGVPVMQVAAVRRGLRERYLELLAR
jgi:ABC-2 type transport system ATP-binding protein